MVKFWTVPFCIMVIFIFVQRSRAEMKITGGEPALPDEFPYQVAFVFVVDTRVLACSGSVLNEVWILTAAHCMIGGRGKRLAVLAGAVDVENEDGKGQLRHYESVIIHEDFDSTENERSHDIALFKMAKPLILSRKHVFPITLPEPKMKVNPDLLVSGWGSSDTVEDPIRYLHKAWIFLFPDCVCQKALSIRFNINTTLCAGNLIADRNVCYGDSGGPMVHVTEDGKFVQVGIVSLGKKCQQFTQHVVGFTDVRYYVEWIRDKTGIN